MDGVLEIHIINAHRVILQTPQTDVINWGNKGSTLDKIVHKLHDANKATLSKLLTADVQNKIKLNKEPKP